MRGTEYVWHEPDRPISVHLHLDVVNRLGLEAMEAYKAVPKRGLEIGGLLLGWRDGADLHIRNYHPVESEHQWGPSYRLSENDLKALDEAVQQHPDVIGLYRTTTTVGKRISLEEDDVKLFRRYFTDDGHLYLLLQPATRNALYCLPEGEGLAAAHSFLFVPSEWPWEVPEPEPSLPAPAPEAEAPAAPPVAEAPPPPRGLTRNQVRWIQAGALLFGVLLGAGVYQGFHSSRQPVPVRTPILTVPSAVTSHSEAPEEPDEPFILTVKRDGRAIQLSWDQKSPVIRADAKAVLYIQDGEQKKQFDLDSQKLRLGIFSYKPHAGDVTFHLSVDSAGHATEAGIRVVGRSEDVASSSAPSDVTPIHKPLALPPPPSQTSTEGSASRVELPEKPEPRPSPFNATPKPAIEPPPTAAPAPPPPAPTPTTTRTAAPDVPVTMEPSNNSRIGQMVGHIPLLRKLKKPTQTYVPPAPIHEVHPVLSARERRSINRDVQIDVRVSVAKTGKVQDVELVGRSGNPPLLADLALSAARHWEFTPARMGQDKVPGEVILRFRFLLDGPPPPQTSEVH